MTEQQKKAVEEQAKDYFGYVPTSGLGKQAKELYTDGMQEVIDKPSKYGLQPINEWVSVKERLPDQSGVYNCKLVTGSLSTLYFKKGDDRFRHTVPVAYWQDQPINEREEG